jgi:hypothetical protein
VQADPDTHVNKKIKNKKNQPAFLNYILKKKYPQKSYIRAVKNLISCFY